VGTEELLLLVNYGRIKKRFGVKVEFKAGAGGGSIEAVKLSVKAALVTVVAGRVG
jgi:hypothetical protein